MGREKAKAAPIRGRKKIYEKACTLEKAVEGYFRSISAIRPVMEPVDTGKVDKYGHTVYRMEPVTNEDGDEIRERVYFVPPSLYGLTSHIGVSMDTWRRYGQDEDLADVVIWAEEYIQGWEDQELRRRENKRTAGLINSMDRNERARISRRDPSQGSSTGLEGLSDAQLLAMAEQIAP